MVAWPELRPFSSYELREMIHGWRDDESEVEDEDGDAGWGDEDEGWGAEGGGGE